MRRRVGTGAVAFTAQGGRSNEQTAREFGEFVRSKIAQMSAEKASIVQRKLALTFVAQVLPATPVDKGRARGGWQLEVGRTPRFVDRLDPGGNIGLADANNILGSYQQGIQAGRDPEIVWIGNNVPYIEVLDSGLKVRKSGRGKGTLVPYSSRGSQFFRRALQYTKAIAAQIR